MTIFNRRNAALGWLTWTVGKQFAERKARSAAGREEGQSRTKKKKKKTKLVLGTLAAAGAVLFVWRRHDGGEESASTDWRPPDVDEAPPDAE